MNDVLFETEDGEFVLFEDGSWEALQDGIRVHGSAFTRYDLTELSERADRIQVMKIGLFDNDRYGAQ